MSWGDRDRATVWDVVGYLGGFLFLCAVSGVGTWVLESEEREARLRLEKAARMASTTGVLEAVTYESRPWGSSTIVLPRLTVRYTAQGHTYEHVRLSDPECVNCGVVDESVGFYSSKWPSESAALARRVIAHRFVLGNTETVYYPPESPADAEVRIGPPATRQDVALWWYLLAIGGPLAVPVLFFAKFRLGRER